MTTGYAHPSYAEALAEFGEPLALERCDGRLLQRRIPGSVRYDAMGSYPLFACRDWTPLQEDLAAIGNRLVSVTLVADPFGDHTPGSLAACFPDRLTPFKEHYIADLDRPLETFVSRRHRRETRKALNSLVIERAAHPADWLDSWTALYGVLRERHAIQGISAFSRASFAAQLRVPGIRAYRAEHDGETVSMVLWYVRGEVAYYHLGASSDAGYRLRGAFGLFSTSLEDLRSMGLRYADLGAGAGLKHDANDGLAAFKQGWSTSTRTAWLCGRILDRRAYDELSGERADDNYFPRYRSGEFERARSGEASAPA